MVALMRDTPPGSVKKPAPTILLVGALALGATGLFLFNPTTTPFYPKCLFHEMTGLYCPGCGSTRALHCLLHGELGAALHENALAVLALPLVGFMALRSVLRRRPPVAGRRFQPIWLVVVVAVIVTFGVLRNIPRQPFLWLAPPAEVASDTK